MSVVVFTGPTLSPRKGRELLPRATFLGPAACGDVYEACKLGARSVVLIDGYFDHRLAVWHKEILWALSSGCEVYGAASMGAIRAAELDVYGMVGAGVVYDWFRQGELEDDDEVAVVHEPAERGYKTLSDAMVNIRATLRAALSDGVIDSGAEAELVATGKATFYPDRRFGTLLEAAARLTPFHRTRLRSWFETRGLIDQKHMDAVALLTLVAQRTDGEAPESGRKPAFSFASTNYWCSLQARLDRTKTPLPEPREPDAEREAAPAPVTPPAMTAEVARTLEALREASKERYAELEKEAFERALALLIAELSGAAPTPSEVQTESERIRKRHNLLTPEETMRWLEQNRLNLENFTALARDQVLVERFRNGACSLAFSRMRDVLRLAGLLGAP